MATAEAPSLTEAEQTLSYLKAAQPDHTALHHRWERSRNADGKPLDAELDLQYKISSKAMNWLLDAYLPQIMAEHGSVTGA